MIRFYYQITDIFSSTLGHFLSKMSLDSNASALDAGLDVILTFIENASVSLIRSYTERLCANVFEKAIGARVTTVTRGRTIVLKLMEMDDPILCTTTMLGLLADKKVGVTYYACHLYIHTYIYI